MCTTPYVGPLQFPYQSEDSEIKRLVFFSQVSTFSNKYHRAAHYEKIENVILVNLLTSPFVFYETLPKSRLMYF